MVKKLLFILIAFFCLISLNSFTNPPAPAQASIIGEPCSISWIDYTIDPLGVIVDNTWVDDCPMNCNGVLAGNTHDRDLSKIWCVEATPPANIPGVFIGSACSGSSSRTVTLITDGTLGTSFDVEGNGQVIPGTTSFTFTNLPEGLFTARGQAHNLGGSSGWSAPVTGQQDYSAPTTTHNFVGLTGYNGWYISPVTVSLTANDAGCLGVSQTAYAVNGTPNNYTGAPFVVSNEGPNTLQYRSTDGSNTEAQKSAVFGIDTIEPNLAILPDSPANSSGWYNVPVSVTVIAEDTTSGIDTVQQDVNGAGLTPYSAPVVFDTDGVHTLDAQATDRAGNLNYDGVVIQLDSTAPTLVPSVTGTQNGTTWYISAPTMSLTATDATSGVAGLGYTVNGGGLNLYSSPVIFNQDGVYNIQLIALDNAQNNTTQSIQIQFDSTAPQMSINLVGDKGQNGWFISPPAFSVTATDTTSQIGNIGYNIENGGWNTYSAPVKITREGLYSISVQVSDNATNSTAHTFQMGYDITPPQTSATLTETEGGMVVTLNRWDGVSGFALTRMAINGVWQDYHHPVTITGVGEYWVQYFTTDFAGNIEAEKITSFTIEETGVVITQNPPVVNTNPPANPPNTPPFETDDDFPPNLGDETIFYVSPPPPPVIILTPPTFSDDNRTSNNGDGRHTNNNNLSVHGDPPNISRLPVIRENTETTRLSDVFPLEAHIPLQPEPMEYVEHPVAFESVSVNPVIYSSETESTKSSTSPLDVTMLAMLGLTMAGAGVMKSQTAITKQKELENQKSQELAGLQAQLDTQKADASANWEHNLAMQANAKQIVMTQVTQSQANKDFWVAYAIWKAQVALVEAKKRAQELAKRQIQVLAKNQATLKAIASKNQKSSSTKTKPVEESTSQGKLVNESTNRNKPTLKKGIAGLAMLGALFLGGSALISNTPQQSPYGPLTCLSEITINCVPGPGGGGGNGSGSQSYDHVNQADGIETQNYKITDPEMLPLATFAYGLFDIINTAKNIAEFPVRVIQSMTFAEIVAEVASMAYAPIDLVYNGLQLADDILTGNVGWHNVFNFIPFASVAFRNFGVFQQVDEIGSGGGLVDNGDNFIPHNPTFDDLVAQANEIDIFDLNYTVTVANHTNDYIGSKSLLIKNPYFPTRQVRPYNDSRLLIGEIMQSAPPQLDVVPTALKWEVEGALNGVDGIWELVINIETQTVIHFIFKSN